MHKYKFNFFVKVCIFNQKRLHTECDDENKMLEELIGLYKLITVNTIYRQIEGLISIEKIEIIKSLLFNLIARVSAKLQAFQYAVIGNIRMYHPLATLP